MHIGKIVDFSNGDVTANQYHDYKANQFLLLLNLLFLQHMIRE